MYKLRTAFSPTYIFPVVWLKRNIVEDNSMAGISYVAKVERQILEICLLRWRLARAQAKLDRVNEMHWAAVVSIQDHFNDKGTHKRKNTSHRIRERRRRWWKKQMQISERVLDESDSADLSAVYRAIS